MSVLAVGGVGLAAAGSLVGGGAGASSAASAGGNAVGSLHGNDKRISTSTVYALWCRDTAVGQLPTLAKSTLSFVLI